jgi:hypothetical protein
MKIIEPFRWKTARSELTFVSTKQRSAFGADANRVENDMRLSRIMLASVGLVCGFAPAGPIPAFSRVVAVHRQSVDLRHDARPATPPNALELLGRDVVMREPLPKSDLSNVEWDLRGGDAGHS